LNRFFFFLFVLLIVSGVAAAQTVADTVTIPLPDSLQQKDTIAKKDSLITLQRVGTAGRKAIVDSTGSGVVKPAKAAPTFPGNIRNVSGKDLLFYAMLLLFIIFAALRRAFPKYFNDLFRLFFKTTIKQRQIREQLMQTPLPSLLLNGFFIISGGLYIAFLLQHYSINPVGNFWLMFLYCAMGLSVAYFVKFAGLKICGWLFNMDEVADSYIFIVFIVNKMMGILLLPFLLLLAFSLGGVYSAGLTLSWCLIGGLLVYRFILTYAAVRNQVRVNLFHFFLYLCAFEIAPLLLVYKALLIFFNQTT
jgi:Domain of unknown function (DUF4271)